MMNATRKTLDASQFLEEAAKSYLEKTRGEMTASKLKLIGNDAWAFMEKFIKENPLFAEEETKSLSLGTMADFYASYGEEAFFQKYYIPEDGEKYFKPDEGDSFCADDFKNINFQMEELTELIEIAKSKNRGTKTNEDKLTTLRVKTDFMNKIGEKIVIIPSEGSILLSIFEEMKRQPLFRHMDPKGTRQHKLSGKFETPFGVVEIAGTPDTIFYDDDHIDDTKTVGVKGSQSFENSCKYNILDYEYIFSMAFYALLYCLETGRLPKKLTLSFFGTNSGNKFLQYEIPTQIWHPEVEKIKALLSFYAECKKDDVWPGHVQIHNDKIFRHINCPFYTLNPGSIQQVPIPYFE